MALFINDGKETIRPLSKCAECCFGSGRLAHELVKGEILQISYMLTTKVRCGKI